MRNGKGQESVYVLGSTMKCILLPTLIGWYWEKWWAEFALVCGLKTMEVEGVLWFLIFTFSKILSFVYMEVLICETICTQLWPRTELQITWVRVHPFISCISSRHYWLSLILKWKHNFIKYAHTAHISKCQLQYFIRFQDFRFSQLQLSVLQLSRIWCLMNW